jgi:hypothetical protein
VARPLLLVELLPGGILLPLLIGPSKSTDQTAARGTHGRAPAGIAGYGTDERPACRATSCAA